MLVRERSRKQTCSAKVAKAEMQRCVIFVWFVHVYCYETAAAGYVPEGYRQVLAGFLAGMNWIQTASGMFQEGFGWLPCGFWRVSLHDHRLSSFVNFLRFQGFGTEILRKAGESFAKVARKLPRPESMGFPFQ